LNASPGFPPIASTVVFGSAATACRFSAGSARCTSEPAGTSLVSPFTVNVARPFSTR
jgi:hypothetical protein